MQLGQKGHSAAGPEGIQPTQGRHVEGVFEKYVSSRRSEPVRARACLNLTGGAHPSECEADRRAPRPSLSTLCQRGQRAHRRRCGRRRGDLRAPMCSGRSRRSGGGGDGRRSSLVRRRRGHAAEELRQAVTPAVSGSYREGDKGEMISRARWFQIGRERGRRRPVPRERRRAEAAELELDLELERL